MIILSFHFWCFHILTNCLPTVEVVEAVMEEIDAETTIEMGVEVQIGIIMVETVHGHTKPHPSVYVLKLWWEGFLLYSICRFVL